MRALCRWTIGPVHHLGFEVLEQAVKNMTRLYKGLFDFVICCHQLGELQVKSLTYLGADVHIQEPTADFEPQGWGWKLCPPRLRPDAHEIYMDNDIVLHMHSKSLDRFLETDSVLYCEPKARNYGKYNNLIPEHIGCHTGIFGVPPRFDLASRIKHYHATNTNQTLPTYFDEQGLITACITTYPRAVVIENEEIMHQSPEDIMNEGFRIGQAGNKIAMANQGNTIQWELYRHASKGALMFC